MQQKREPQPFLLDYSTPDRYSPWNQLRRLCVGAFACLAFLSVGTAIASLVARQDVLLSVRVDDDKWEVTKAVSRDMFMALVYAVIARFFRKPSQS
jgi:hypothetical protein